MTAQKHIYHVFLGIVFGKSVGKVSCVYSRPNDWSGQEEMASCSSQSIFIYMHLNSFVLNLRRLSHPHICHWFVKVDLYRGLLFPFLYKRAVLDISEELTTDMI